MFDTARHSQLVDEVFALAPVIPVLAIDRIEDALPLCRALVDNGLPVLEITLRTACAVDAIALIARELQNACVGAGTVLNARDLDAVVQAGARFAISPGATDTLFNAAKTSAVPLIPGIATASELMRGLEHGWRRFKFFPAESSGGIAALKGFGGPLPMARFCPTGGISAQTASQFLHLPNVLCVGGSWLTTRELLQARDWAGIEALARAAAVLPG